MTDSGWAHPELLTTTDWVAEHIADDNVVVVDTENHAVRRIDASNGIVTTIAGGHLGGDGDGGDATKAGLARPHGCGFDDQDNLFIADSDNHRVRVVGR